MLIMKENIIHIRQQLIYRNLGAGATPPHLRPYLTAYRLYQTGRIGTGIEGIAVHHGTCKRVHYTGRIYTPGLFADSEKDGSCSEKYKNRIRSDRRRAYYSCGGHIFFTKGTEKVQNTGFRKIPLLKNPVFPRISHFFHKKLALSS